MNSESSYTEIHVNPWLIAMAVMLATFMEVLDTSVANVALPHIAGSLSSSTDEATWVLTSYLVSNAIVLPATGWLGRVFGRKRFLLACILLFTLSSCLCGFAPSLGTLIAARILQGVGGGALQPISQSILLESFPPSKRGMAMGVFAVGVVVAPIVGPTLGGWLTDNYSWRWIFLVNLPVGLVSYLMVQAFIFDPSYIRKGKVESIDYWGLSFMVIWLASLQIILDKGEQVDWFGSPWILFASILSGLSMVAFIFQEIKTRHPIVDLRILLNRNFAVGVALMTVTGAVLYGSTALLPLYMQELMGYTAFLAGVALSPRGVGALVTSAVIRRVVGKIDERYIIATGFLILGISNYWLGHINLGISIMNIIVPVVVNGVAISFIFVPSPRRQWELWRTPDGKRRRDLQPDAQHRRELRHLHPHHPPVARGASDPSVPIW
jgi:DHA2 family multidrug resistance protein